MAVINGDTAESFWANKRSIFKVLLVCTLVVVFMVAMSNNRIPTYMLSPLSSSINFRWKNLSKNETSTSPWIPPVAGGVLNYTPVMIVTYFRSGSSLTGEVMQRHRDAFYVFEPLRVVQELQEHHGNISYVLDRVRLIRNYDPVRLRYDIIEGWLTCNFTKIPVQSFTDNFMEYGNKSSTVLQCLKKGAKWVYQIKACILALQQKCARSKYRIIKTIRMRMDEVVNVMRRLPDLKVINLVRDPRGTIESRRNRNKCQDGLPECAKSLCAQLQSDIDVKQNIANIARRTFTVRYENMAHSPIETSRLLYNFTGIPFLDRIQDYILNITHGSSAADCRVCTEKWQLGQRQEMVNASEHVSKWKDRWNRTIIDNVQHICGKVMRHYNYKLQ